MALNVKEYFLELFLDSQQNSSKVGPIIQVYNLCDAICNPRIVSERKYYSIRYKNRSRKVDNITHVCFQST